MIRKKKPRKNQRKGKKAKRGFNILHRFVVILKVISGLGMLVAASGLFIFLHDIITQCDYFKATSVTIEGNQRLTRKQIAEQARIAEGMNILAVNLTVARKRLLAHPWIAEAELLREVPSGLAVRVKEHVPLAIVDLGRKFLINEKGAIFKTWTGSDPAHLPVVKGLQMSDITAYDDRERLPGKHSPEAHAHPSKPRIHFSPLDAVMRVLRLGKQSECVLPNRIIQQIRVDRELGITLQVRSRVKIIKLGYHHYTDKYSMLSHIQVQLKKRRNVPVFESIDLNNLNRIVVRPRRHKAGSENDKEV
jgi:cell division protein FtsQ